MADVNANININADVRQAMDNLRQLQDELSKVSKAANQVNPQAAGSAGAGFARQVDQLKQYRAEIVKTSSATAQLQKAIDSGKLSFGQNMKNAMGVFRQNSDMSKLAAERAEKLNTQYVQMTENLNGVGKSIAARPLQGMIQDSAVAAQKTQLFAQSLHMAGNSLQDWGKNVQWAGRQLTVGFTVPITLFARKALEAFKGVDEAMVAFKRVYGDFSTQRSEVDSMADSIQELALETTKWGQATKETINLAADLAAAGFSGADLIDKTTQVVRLATLGMMDQQVAMGSVISMSTAFKQSNEELAESINYLNAVENETVLAIEDISEAIPRVAPVIKGLGGDVKDLAVFLTAMKEGGVNATEGANALKTGLARLITPTRQAREAMEGMGINIDEILSGNRGDLQGLIQEFGAAMDVLTDFQKQEVLSATFGKMQFARLGALFDNINQQGGQAQRALELAGMTAEDLAAIADGELSKIEESASVKMTAAIEKLTAAMAPIGEMFAEVITPIIDKLSSLLEWFNGLGDGAKFFAKIGVAILALSGPFIMLIGQVGNLVGSFIKAGVAFFKFSSGIKYLSGQELDLKAQTDSLRGSFDFLTDSAEIQRAAIDLLAGRYANLALQMRGVAGAAAAGIPGTPPMGYATGGKVPGVGNTDKIPAVLTPGEFVVKKSVAEKHTGFLSALNSGAVRGFSGGSAVISGTQTLDYSGVASTAKSIESFERMLQRLVDNGFEAAGLFDYLQQKIQETGGTLTQVAADVKAEFGALSSYAGTERAHVADDISGSAGVAAIKGAGGGFAASDAALEDLIDALQRIGTDALESSVTIKALGNAVADLPKGVNQLLKGDGMSSGAEIKSLFTADQRNNPATLMTKMTDQMMAMGSDVDTAAAAADQVGQEFLQLLDAVDDDAIVVESKELAENMRASGQNAVSINDLMEQAAMQTRESIPGFAEAWDAITQEVSSFRVTLREDLQKYREQLKAEGIGIESLPSTGGSTNTRITSNRGSTDVKNAGTRKTAGGGDIYYGKNISKGNSEEIAQAQGRIAAERYIEGFRQGLIANDAEMQAAILQMFGGDQGAMQQFWAEAMAAAEQGSEQLENFLRSKGPEFELAFNQALGNASPSRIARRALEFFFRGAQIGAEEGGQRLENTMRTEGQQAAQGFDDGLNAGGGAGGGGAAATSGFMDKGAKRMKSLQGGNIGKGLGAVSMVGGLVSMGAMATGNETLGKAGGIASMFTMAASSVASLLPMMGKFGVAILGLIWPLTALAAAVAVIGGGLWKWRDYVDSSARAATAAGVALSGVAGAAKKASDIFGKATLGSREKTAKYSDEEKAKYQEYAGMLEGEGGQAFIEGIRKAGFEQGDYAADVIEEAIINGMIDAADAPMFARALGETMQDAKFGESLARRMEKFSDEFTTASATAARKATEAFDKYKSSSAAKDVENLQQNGGSIDYKNAAFIIGAAAQNLQDFRTATLAAKQDWETGQISWQEYDDIVNQATQAQLEYADALRYARNNVNDFGAFEQANKEAWILATGRSAEDYENIMKNFAEGLGNIDYKSWFQGGGGFQYDETKVQEDYTKKLLDTTNLNLEEAEAQAEKVAKGLAVGRVDFISDMRKAYETAAGAITELTAQGMTESEAFAIGEEIAKPWTDASKLYTEATEELGMTATEAANYINSALNAANDPNNWRNENGGANLATSFDAWNKKVGFDADFIDLSNSMNASQITEVLKGLNQTSGAGRDEENAKQFAATMGGYGNLGISSEALAGASSAIAESIKNGIEDGGLEGMNKLADIVDDEGLEEAFVMLSEDGMIGGAEIDILIKKLGELSEVQPDNLNAYGIDPTDVRQVNDLTDEMIRTFQDLDKTVMDSEFLGYDAAAVKSVVGGKVLDLVKEGWNAGQIDDFITNELLKPLDKIGEINNVDKKVDLVFDVASDLYLDGEEMPPELKSLVENELVKTYGEDWKDNLSVMDPIQFMQTIFGSMELEGMDASGLKQAAQGMRGAAKMLEATDPEGAAQMMAQAAAYDAAAAVLAGSGGGGAPPKAGGTGRREPKKKKSGSGGGGKKADFFKGLKDNLKLAQDLYGTTVEQYVNKNNKTQGLVDAIREQGVISEELLQAAIDSEDPVKALKKINSMSKAEQKELQKTFKLEKALNAEGAFKGQKLADREKLGAANRMVKDGLDQATRTTIMNDENLLAMYMYGGKRGRKQAEKGAQAAINIARQTGDALKTELEKSVEEAQRQLGMLEAQLLGIRLAFEQSYKEINGASYQEDEQQKETNDAWIAYWQNRISAKQMEIKKQEELLEPIQDEIDLIKEAIDAENDKIDALEREDELRMREAEALQRDLDELSRREDAINEAYDKRIEALDEVANINQRIADQQQRQLGLADALSRGDIAAAAAAREEINAAAAQAAAEDQKKNLETGRDNAIAGLTLPNGMTREQAEERIRHLEELSYQTSLKIRDIKDVIYGLNQDIAAKEEEMLPIRENIKDIEKEIRSIERDKIRALEEQNIEIEGRQLLLEAQYQQETQQMEAEAAHMARQIEVDEARNSALAAFNEMSATARKRANQTADAWERAARAMASVGTANVPGGAAKMFGGLIPGSGNRDTYPAMLTPGEFVVTKPIVKQFGADFFENINKGQMPTYAVAGRASDVSHTAGGLTNIEAPMYNTYNVNVSTSSNASPDEIANVVIQKISTIGSQNIRRNNGY